MTTAPILPTLPIPQLPADIADAGQPLHARIADAIAAHGGWLPFDRFMALALYAPGLGYYTGRREKFGLMPHSARGADGHGQGGGSDFVTAPELSPLFGQTLAKQIAQALKATGTDEIWEFGAGTGALALQLLDALDALDVAVRRYTIVDVSGSLQAHQRATLRGHAGKLQWATELPARFSGVVVGNEVLDAMPVQLLQRTQGQWHERGVACSASGEFVWVDLPTELRPPLEVEGAHDYLTEIHLQAEAFVRTLGDRLQAGAVFLLDYGFPEREYYHPQRHMGTVMCHQAHRADADPLAAVGDKDITAHVNFTGIAVAAQDVGLELLGYTSQAHFLINCGLAEAMQQASLPQRVAANKLLMEHEMGELFKAIGLVKGAPFDALGFARGDRSHRL